MLVGGLAATLHGSPVTTQDADICPERTPENLERLAAAMRELRARIRTEGVEDGLPFACDAKFFEMANRRCKRRRWRKRGRKGVHVTYKALGLVR